MRATVLRRIVIVLAALLVSACAGLRPGSDPMTFAGSPSASMPPALQEGVSFSVNFDAALRQAQDLRKHGDLDSAARVLGQLVIAAPNDARVIGEYGKVMLESGRTDDAVAFLERAITLRDGDWTLFSALGVAYDQTGKPEAARAAFNHALALKPGEPAVLSNLALSHIQAGELDDAERLLLQASEGEKDVPGLADKLAMVRNLKGAGAQSSAPRAAPTAAPDRVAPSAPEPAQVEPPTEPDAEPIAPTDPETENAALPVQPPLAAKTSPPKTIAADRPARAPEIVASPNAVQPPPKIAGSRAAASRALASNAHVVQKAVPQRVVAAATSQPAVPRRPAGVARAIARTATIPPESWESTIRISLPSPSDASPRAAAPIPAAPPEQRTEEPLSWFDALRRWSSAVFGFISRLWG